MDVHVSAPRICVSGFYEPGDFALVSLSVADEHGAFERMLHLSPEEIRKLFVNFHEATEALRELDEEMDSPQDNIIGEE